MTDPGTVRIVYGAALRPYGDAPMSGDAYAVIAHAGGTLLAVIDGLGHGPAASLAAGAALSVLQERAGAPLEALFHACEGPLRATRGAAIALADIRGPTLTWLSIGNVAGVLWPAGGRPPRHVLQMSGFVGGMLPTLRPGHCELQSGDLLLFASDGIASGFADLPPAPAPPQQIADTILATHGLTTDDAVILAVRYLGSS